jgi:hypothetical protein
MGSSGLWYFAERRPHDLALAAPDGRHWSYGEFWNYCQEIYRQTTVGASRAVENTSPKPPGVTERVALQVIRSCLSPGHDTSRPGHGDQNDAGRRELPTPTGITGSAITFISQYGVPIDPNNVHYCAANPDDQTESAWVVASLHAGHPVVMGGSWNPYLLLRDIAVYRVTSVLLGHQQIRDLLQLPEGDGVEHGLRSVHYPILREPDCPTELRAQFSSRWNRKLIECATVAGDWLQSDY